MKVFSEKKFKGTEVRLWLNKNKYKILKPSFLERLDLLFTNNKFTKSLKGSLIGPVKRLDDNNFILKGKSIATVYITFTNYFLFLLVSIDEQYCDSILTFFCSSILHHDHLNITEKIELAYALDFFGICLDDNAHKYESINNLRQQLIDYALSLDKFEPFLLITYLIPEVETKELG